MLAELGPGLYRIVGKATDENLTSENWEYILVSILDGVIYISRGVLMLCRMFATGQTPKTPGKVEGIQMSLWLTC